MNKVAGRHRVFDAGEIMSQRIKVSVGLDEPCILVESLNLDHMVDREDESFQCHLVLISDGHNDLLYFSLKNAKGLAYE